MNALFISFLVSRIGISNAEERVFFEITPQYSIERTIIKSHNLLCSHHFRTDAFSRISRTLENNGKNVMSIFQTMLKR